MIYKRIFDFCMAFIGTVLVTPLLIIIVIIVKLTSNGPVFFIQNRVGKNTKVFPMIKFRTMKVNHGGNSISVKGESRITLIGSFLRKYKLDELPELLNIIKGDMSFVGPRPDVPGYADKLGGDDRIILSIRPGITGPASLKYSNEEEILAEVDNPVWYNDNVIYPDKVQLNKNYIRHWSFALDVKIICYTIIGKKLEEPWFQ